MRILQVYDHVGINCGVMSTLMNWYRNLNNNDIKFDFLVSYKKEPSFEEEIEKLGGHVFYMSDASTLSYNLLFTLKKNVELFMRDNSYKYDAIHLHSAIFAFPYLTYAQKYGIKNRICHAHSTSLGNTKFTSLRNTLLLLPLKKTATAYLACSKQTGRLFYEKYGINNYTVLLNGVDFHQYLFNQEMRNKIRKEWDVDNNTIIVGHISNMSSVKNVEFVIQTFAQILKQNPNCYLYLIGRQELPIGIVKQIYNYQIENHVRNLGVRSDIPNLLQGIDVCLMPSKAEGFGLVAIECQAANVPVITSFGFPKDIYLTPKCYRIGNSLEQWANKALEVSRERLQICDLTNLQIFDINEINKQLINYYKTLNV